MLTKIGNEKFRWEHAQSVSAYTFQCGYCGEKVASERGWHSTTKNNVVQAHIFICPNCTCPTFHHHGGFRLPVSAMGNAVSGIVEKHVQALYSEARHATAAGCYTAAVLCCRKLLMHIAVSKGAAEGESFVRYVEFLSDRHYVPPDAKEWVDHIRKKGNEANHEISMMTEDEASELMSFVEMLLKLIYEFPAAMKKKLAPTAASSK